MNSKENYCIKIKNLVYKAGTRQILDIDGLDIAKGEICALTGSNGSGKTTLLRIIAGLEKLSAGTVDRTIPLSETVMCFQKPYMFTGTVRKNLKYGLNARGKTAIPDGNYKGIIERLHLESYLDRDANALSSGEIQRIAIARALACEPRLLLLDEPITGLDAFSANLIENDIRRFQKIGGTVVMATHDTESVYRLSAEVLRLENGRLANSEPINVIAGNIHNDPTGTFIDAGKIRIYCITSLLGNCRCAIPATDIVLSKTRLESSMRNQYEGIVMSIKHTGGAIEIAVDVGVNLIVLLTETSYLSMGITAGKPVFASFKATPVKVFQ